MYRMIAGFLPEKIDIESAGSVKNYYGFESKNVSADDQQRFRHTMERIPKKAVPLFSIMLKINQTEDDFTFTLSPK